MPRAKAKVVVPGAADVAPTPAPKKARKLAVVDPNGPAATADLPPAITRSIEGARQMTYAEAMEANRKGELKKRVLTEKGWVVPEQLAEE